MKKSTKSTSANCPQLKNARGEYFYSFMKCKEIARAQTRDVSRVHYLRLRLL